MPLNSQHDYGPNSQQPDVPPAELHLLCSEFYQREVVVTPVEAQQIETDTQGQAEAKLWYHHRRLRVTSSNFGKIAKRRATTPVAAQVKCLLYGKNLETKAIRWGCSHEDDARKAYVQYLAENGHPDATVSKAGLVINIDEPCLASSPDGFVNIPGTDEPLGIVEFKCPYSLARDFVTPQDAATSMRSFCCKIGGHGNVKLKTNHDCHFQVQGALAIMKRPWCDFVVWTPTALSVQRIRVDTRLWNDTKGKLVEFYMMAFLPELAHPRHILGQSIREPFRDREGLAGRPTVLSTTS